MRKRKFPKLIHKKEELPSFLKNLKTIPDDIEIPPRSRKSESYLGPVFFGECLQFHPPHRSVPLNNFHNGQFSAPLKDNALKDIFLTPSVHVKEKFELPIFRPVIRQQKVFVDPYPHRCPGFRKIFAPDVFVSEGLGETASIIEGEMSREIPFCRVKKISSDCFANGSKTELEIVTLSDIREEKRPFMSYKERMAHAHFPKEFVTVRIIGPTIPELITITKLPTKRQASFEIDAHLKSKPKKGGGEKGKESPKDEVEKTEKGTEEAKESDHDFLILKGESIEGRPESDDMEKDENSETGEEGDRQQSEIIREEEEETVAEGLEEEAAEGEEEKGPSQETINEEEEDPIEVVPHEEENPPEEVEN